MTATFAVSASQLSLFERCPRSWFLKHVARAPDDDGAGGLYLQRGNDFDQLVQAYVRDGRTGDPLAPRLANRQLAAALRYLPTPRTAAVQFAYDLDAGGFRVRGKPDLRRPPRDGVAWIGDTKTTSDRGPGVGAASDRPAYALTDVTLRLDVQFRLYAWCECALDAAVHTVAGDWTYVSKADRPHVWPAAARIGRAEVEAWFAAYVRPAVARMQAYAAQYDDGEPGGLTAEAVPATPDSCRRCFVQRACPGPYEGVNVYGITGPLDPNRSVTKMAFNLAKLQNKTPPAPAAPPPPALADTLAASVAAVAINRPARTEPPPALTVTTASGVGIDCSETLTVTTIEGPVAAFGQLEHVTPEATTEPPKARRGRPRKTPTTTGPGADTAAPLATTPASALSLVCDALAALLANEDETARDALAAARRAL